jgi:4-amino-4-deoxy-L-arabinose transferase-like glycosyltransferase
VRLDSRVPESPSPDVVVTKEAPNYRVDRGGYHIGMIDAAGTLDSARHERHLFAIGLLLATALSLTLNFYRLGGASLKEVDEAYEALTAREMLQTGNWLTPYLNGVPRYTKPPLYFWLVAVNFRIIGPTEFALRFWSAAAGAGAVLLTGLIGRRLFGARAGVLAACALATSSSFIYFHGARSGCMDAMAAFWIAAGMLCVVSRGTDPRFLVAAGLAFGLASLTKNFLGLPAAGLVGIHLYATRSTNDRIPASLIRVAAATVLTISLAWPATMLILHGRAFGDVFLLRENLGRFHLGGRYPWGKFPPAPFPQRVNFLARTLFKGFFPWGLIAPLMIPWTFLNLKEWRRDDRALAFFWAGLYAAGMLAVSNPLAWYAYLFFPAVAILIGAFVEGLLPAGRHGVFLTSAAGALAAGTLLFRLRWSGYRVDFHGFLPVGLRIVPAGAALVPPIALAAILVYLIRMRPRLGRAFLVSELTVASAAFALAPLRLAEEVSNSKLLAKRIEAVAPEYGNKVTFWNIPGLAPTGRFADDWCEARWYLLGMSGVTIRNFAVNAALPPSLSRPRLPTLVLTRREVVDRLPPHRNEEDFRIWKREVALAGLPGER